MLRSTSNIKAPTPVKTPPDHFQNLGSSAFAGSHFACI